MPILAQSSGRDDMVYRGILSKVMSCTTRSEKAVKRRLFGRQRSIRYNQSLFGSGIFKCLPDIIFHKNSGAQFHAEAHISTQPPSPLQSSRLSHSNEDQERSRRIVPAAREGPQACVGECRPPRLVHFSYRTRDQKFVSCQRRPSRQSSVLLTHVTGGTRPRSSSIAASTGNGDYGRAC
jgi:hypothetical protein